MPEFFKMSPECVCRRAEMTYEKQEGEAQGQKARETDSRTQKPRQNVSLLRDHALPRPLPVDEPERVCISTTKNSSVNRTAATLNI